MLVTDTNLEYVAPFTVDNDVENFFHGGHWGQCLDLLSHLCQYSESILLISGPSGIGKSSLKKALMLREADKFSFCEVQATASLNADSLMAKIDTTLDKPLRNDLVLLIEDAQNLSIDVTMLLLQLKQRLDVQRHMQIVLFAAPDFEQKISKSVLKEDFSTQVHMIELEPLTLAETEAFLIHQWRVSGNHGSLPFDKAMFKKLYSMSGGNPGKLQNLSRDSVSNNKINKSISIKRGLSPVMVGSIVSLGLLFCVMAFLWPAADDSQISRPAIKLAAIPQSDINHQLKPAPILAAALESEPETETEIATTATPNQALEVEIDHEEKISLLEKKVNDLQQQLIQERESRRNLESKSQKKAPQQKAQKPIFGATKQPANYTKDEKLIMSIPSKNYTLQLVGSSNEQKIQQFIKENNLTGKAHYFKSIYQGKPWFIVIYGNYASRTSAVAALDRLPASVLKLQPWPREYSYIQGTIKKK